jgi:pimeloyl-ACP methyl ester carboxylesterase
MVIIDGRTGGAPSTGPADRLLVFFHGFMTSPRSYRQLLGGLAADGLVVAAPRMYRPGPAALAGRPSATEEAETGVTVVEDLRRTYRPRELWLAGHSRGGQVAWLVAGSVDSDGVIVIDPVDGGGPKATRPNATAMPADFDAATLVIGAGLGGRCAPTAVNHERFAAVAPPGATHVVLDGMGHADLLDDRSRRAGRLLCPGGDDPDRSRRELVGLMREFMGE